MSTNMNSLKNHPAFLAFRGANVKPSTKETQIAEDEERAREDSANNKKVGE